MPILDIAQIYAEPKKTAKKLTAGRFEFGAKVEEGPRASVVLRIHTDGRTFSGDVFSPNSSQSAQRLGGRTDWDYSFQGKLRTYEGDRLLAACSVLGRNGRLRPANGVMAGMVQIEIDRKQKPTAMQFELFTGSPQGVIPLEVWKNRTTIKKVSKFYRRIGLTIGVTQRALDFHEFGRVSNFLEKVGKGIRNAVARSGIDLIVNVLEERPVTNIANAYGGSLVDQARDLMGEVFMMRPETKFENVDWSHVLLIHTERMSPEESIGLGGLMGRAYGLGDPPDRFLSRYGAMLNAEAIDAMFVRKSNETTASKIEYLDGMDKKSARLARTKTAAIRLAMHELGHLLNLPHPWNRETSNRFLGRSNPASASVTNYPHRRPFGLAASHTLSEDNAITRSEIRKANIEELENPDHVKFDEAETDFIWHAPLPLIAQGGQTFADQNLPPPQIKVPPDPEKLNLVIGYGVLGTPPIPLNEIGLSMIEDDYGFLEYQPTPKNLFLHYIGEPGEGARPDFNMKNGATQFYIYEDRLPEVNGALRECKTVVYDADYMFERAIFDASGNRFSSRNHAPELLAPASQFFQFGESGVSIMNLPWLNEIFINSAFSGVRRKLRVQAVYYKDTKTRYRSNILTINFDRVVDMPHPRPRNYAQWIDDPETRQPDRDQFEEIGNQYLIS